MTFFSTYFLSALGIGLTTGIFSGAFGIGGGTVSTPLMRLFMDIEPHVAVGTTMALIIPTSISAALNYYLKKEIDLKMGFTMVLPAVTGAVLGATATTIVNGPVLMILFAAFVGFSGVDLIFGLVGKSFGKGKGGKGGKDARSLPRDPAQSTALLLIIGFLAGGLAGFFGVGGGFIFTPCLMHLFGTPIKTAFGTSLLVVAALSIPGTITHALAGHVNFGLMFAMIGGAIPGSFVGSALALRLKDSWLRRSFGIVMSGVAFTLVIRELL